MPESISPNAVWDYDYVDHYRLNKDIINAFLTRKWGNYKYYIKVNAIPSLVTSRSLTTHSARVMSLDSGCLVHLAG